MVKQMALNELEQSIQLAFGILEPNRRLNNQLYLPEDFGRGISAVKIEPETNILKLKKRQLDMIVDELKYLKRISGMFANDRFGCDQEIGIALMNFHRFVRDKPLERFRK